MRQMTLDTLADVLWHRVQWLGDMDDGDDKDEDEDEDNDAEDDDDEDPD
jgi:hypothetical protein